MQTWQHAFAKLIWNKTLAFSSPQNLHSQPGPASSWQRAVYDSFVRIVSSVLGSRGERNTEVFFYPVWASNSKAERPQRSRSSWLAAVHAARALHTSVSASSAPSCVSSVRPLFRSWILCNEAKHFDLFGIILLHSRLWISSQSPFRLPWYKKCNISSIQRSGFLIWPPRQRENNTVPHQYSSVECDGH